MVQRSRAKPLQRNKEMKVLSIRNPWAYLIAYGVKNIENRSWNTKYRGPLLIHSSGPPHTWVNLDTLPKQFQTRANAALDDGVPYEQLDPDLRGYSDLVTMMCKKYDVQNESDETFNDTLMKRARGRGCALKGDAIIGRVDLIGVTQDSQSPWALPYHYHWRLTNAELLDPPITGVKGKLRLWNFDIATPRG